MVSINCLSLTIGSRIQELKAKTTRVKDQGYKTKDQDYLENLVDLSCGPVGIVGLFCGTQSFQVNTFCVVYFVGGL